MLCLAGSKMVSRLYRAHGEFCASHPWEVIVATLTLTACMLTVEQPSRPGGLPTGPQPPTDRGWTRASHTEQNADAVDMIMMTVIRCVAVLYSYYQFCQLHKLGSKYILGKWRMVSNRDVGGSCAPGFLFEIK